MGNFDTSITKGRAAVFATQLTPACDNRDTSYSGFWGRIFQFCEPCVMPLARMARWQQHRARNSTAFTLKNQRFALFRKQLGVAMAALLFGSGAAAAQVLDVESLARAPAVSSVSMSAEGDFLVGIVADPKNKDKRALATWSLAGVDGTKPLAVQAVTPGNEKMGFVQVNALKAGKVLALASQAWTGNLSGCGEGRATGATKTGRYKSFLTDKTIKDFDDLFANGRSLGVSAETLACLEIGANPNIIDLPLDPENVIVKRVDPTTLVANFSKVNLKTGKSDFMYRDVGDLAIGRIDPRDGKVRTKGKIDPTGNTQYNAETYILNPDNG